MSVSSEHGVSSLIYYWLEKSDIIQAWPKKLVYKLHYCFMRSEVVEQLRTRELGRLLAQFQDSEVRPILLKGAALSHTHYPVPGLRERCDTDLFINVDTIEPVQRMMIQNGYTIDYPFLKSHQFVCSKKFGENLQHHYDIHWRMSNISRFARLIGYKEALSQSIEIPQVSDARGLGDIHALALACVHLEASTKPGNARLLWLYDIHLLLTSMSKDEQVQFACFAVNREIQGICLKAFRICKLYFNTHIIEQVEKRLSTPVANISLPTKFRLSNLGVYIDDLLILPGFRLKSKLLMELFFPRPSYLLNQYKKDNILWFPALLLYHIFTGLFRRLLLR